MVSNYSEWLSYTVKYIASFFISSQDVYNCFPYYWFAIYVKMNYSFYFQNILNYLWNTDSVLLSISTPQDLIAHTKIHMYPTKLYTVVTSQSV